MLFHFQFIFARVSPALPLFVPNSKSTALVVLFPTLNLEVDVVIPVTTAPVFVVTNLVLLLKFNVCPPPEENIADVLLPAKFVTSNVPDLSLKLPVPASSM